MQRITVSLPDDVAALLKDDARRLRRTVSDIVREAVEKELGVHPDCEPKKVPFAALGASGAIDASRIDEYLAEHWAGAITRHRDPD
jgi:Arc/MetJ-type ribon-helix-helix transcriptional regulator